MINSNSKAGLIIKTWSQRPSFGAKIGHCPEKGDLTTSEPDSYGVK